MKTFTEFSAKYVNSGLMAYIKDIDRNGELVSCDELRNLRNKLLHDAEAVYASVKRLAGGSEV